MSEYNLTTAIVHELCPICGRPMNESIVMNRILTKKASKKIEELNGKAIGFSKDACEECTKHKDKCIYVISIDPDKSDNKNIQGLYRTGQIVGIRKDFQLFIDHPELILKTNNGVQFCFIEEEAGKQIGFFK